MISVPPHGRVAVPARGENRAPPSGSVSETNNECQIKFELLHLISMSGKGNCYDNAMVETFFKTLKSELVWRTIFYTR